MRVENLSFECFLALLVPFDKELAIFLFLNSRSIFLIVDPLSLVKLPILCCPSSESILHVILPFPSVNESSLVSIFSKTCSFTILELSFVPKCVTEICGSVSMNCSILEFSLIDNYLAIRSDKVFSTKSNMKRLFTVTLDKTFSVILHPIPKPVRSIGSWIPFTNVFVLSNCHNFLNELPWFTIRIPVHISWTKFSKSFHDVLMHIWEKQFLCFCCDQFLSGRFIHV